MEAKSSTGGASCAGYSVLPPTSRPRDVGPFVMFVVNDRWDATLGGRERYADDLVAYLAAQGRQVTKVTRSGEPPPPGTKVLALTPVRFATHYQLHNGFFTEAFGADCASLDSATRRALYYLGLRLNRRRQELLRDERHVLDGAAELMVFTHSTAARLRDRGITADRIVVSRPGVNLRLFHPRVSGGPPCRADALRLVFVGHNFVLKGLGHAVRAIARAARSGIDVSLAVAGGGRSTPFQRLAAKLNVARRVTFLGVLSQLELADVYRESDALLHPTYYDPFPRVVIEALACGCPVITTAACGAFEILTSGSDAFIVVDPHDVEGMTNAISTLADPSTRLRMRAAAADKGQRFDETAHFRTTTQWLLESGLHR